MIYLLILFFGFILFYYDKIVTLSFSASSFVIAVVVFFMIIISSIQFNVGTDYFNYLNGLKSNNYFRYFNKGEYVYYLFYSVIQYFNLSSQTIFLFSSLINGLALYFILWMLKKEGYSLWIIFFVFFTYTGYFHNQMNGLRQYTAIIYFILFVFLILFKFGWLNIALALFVGFFSHSTFIFSLILCIIIFFVYRLKIYSLKIIYFISLIIYLSSPLFLEYFISNLAPQYLFYLETEYGEGLDISQLFSKLYFLPFFVYFIFLYCRNNSFNYYFNKSHKGFRFLILFWSFTSLMYISSTGFGFMFRVSQFFIFFDIFPLYYIILYSIKSKKLFLFCFLFVSLFVPYFIKVVFFPVREYSYNWVLF